MLPFHSSIFDFCSKVHITYTIDYVKNKNSQIAHSLNHKREDTKYIFVLSGTVTERHKKKINFHALIHTLITQSDGLFLGGFVYEYRCYTRYICMWIYAIYYLTWFCDTRHLCAAVFIVIVGSRKTTREYVVVVVVVFVYSVMSEWLLVKYT